IAQNSTMSKSSVVMVVASQQPPSDRGFTLPTHLTNPHQSPEAAAPAPNREITRRIRIHRTEIALAAPVLQELLFGVYRMPPSARRRELERFIDQVIRGVAPVLPYDEDAALWHAAERARLARARRTPSFVDGQIASIAAVNDLVLVTKNVRDFQHFQNLVIETWSA
ncbi:MAG: PIN domain-containing protein, partial [Dehalococcoidia bacterium]